MFSDEHWIKHPDILSQARLDSIMDKSNDVEVEIDEDSLDISPLVIDEKLFEIHSRMRDLERSRSLIKKSKMKLKNLKINADRKFKLLREDIIANDPTLKKDEYKPQNKRESYILSALITHDIEISNLVEMLEYHDSTLAIIEDKMKSLKETRDFVKDRWEIMKNRMRLGESPMHVIPDKPLKSSGPKVKAKEPEFDLDSLFLDSSTVDKREEELSAEEILKRLGI